MGNLLKFRIENFRSIKDKITLDLTANSSKILKDNCVFDVGDKNKKSLLKSAAIYGANASGKSNIIKAMYVFRKMVVDSFLFIDNISQDLPNEFFKLSEKTERQPSYFDIDFELDGEFYNYGFSICKKQIILEFLIKINGNKILFERNYNDIVYFSKKNFYISRKLENDMSEKRLFLSKLADNNQLLPNKIVDFIKNIKIVCESINKCTIDDWSVYSSNKFSTNDEDENIKHEIKDFINSFNFGIIDVNDYRYCMCHKKYDELGKENGIEFLDLLNNESCGVKKIFSLSAPIIESLNNGEILFIDDLNSNLHTILCQYLISMFNSKETNPYNAQLIFTTHDLSLLDKDLLRRDEIYFTEKNKHGATELFSLADISERQVLDYAKRYLEGRYGALPYIAEFEKKNL